LILPDALEIATAVARAGTTPEVAATIDKFVSKLSPARRRNIRHQVETNPSQFFRLVSIGNIVERTANSAVKNAMKEKPAQPAKALTDSDSNKPLVPLFYELLNHTSNNNKLLTQLLKNQAAPFFSLPSSSQDPRIPNQPVQEDEYNQIWSAFDIITKDDTVMADETKEGDEADGIGEEWVSETSGPAETAQKADATTA
jgi:hypothetical protein